MTSKPTTTPRRQRWRCYHLLVSCIHSPYCFDSCWVGEICMEQQQHNRRTCDDKFVCLLAWVGHFWADCWRYGFGGYSVRTREHQQQIQCRVFCALRGRHVFDATITTTRTSISYADTADSCIVQCGAVDLFSCIAIALQFQNISNLALLDKGSNIHVFFALYCRIMFCELAVQQRHKRPFQRQEKNEEDRRN